jgi:hypothetical protein
MSRATRPKLDAVIARLAAFAKLRRPGTEMPVEALA